MNFRLCSSGFLVLLSVFSLAGCFGKKTDPAPEQAPKPAVKIIKKEAVIKDKELQTLTRYFAQADAIHREAWRVMTGIKLPASKTPFGKLQRAALSAQNIKLTNKSLFSCDRYVMKRDVLAKTGIPQRAEVFEKCSEKSVARKIAYWSYEKNEVVKITFYADQMQEVLGVGATIMNRVIECELRGNASSEVLQSFTCSKWAQDKSAEEMIRLDTYTYKKENKDLLTLKGKVYVNLSEARKIEAIVPLTGKIQVVETELYAPEQEAKPAVDPKAPVLPPGQGTAVKPLPVSPSARPPREDVHESGEQVPEPMAAPGKQLDSNMKQLGPEIPAEPEDPHRVGSPAQQLGIPDPAEVEERQQQEEYQRQQQQQEQGDDGQQEQSDQQGSEEDQQPQQHPDPVHMEQR